jgi:hypothetical protein
MTRLLTFSSILATMVLLQVLGDRPPVLITSSQLDHPKTTMVAEDQTTTSSPSEQSTTVKWPIDLQIKAREALDLWQLEEPILPGMYSKSPRPEPEQLLRAEWICKSSLIKLSQIIRHEKAQPRYLRLNSGSLLRYKDLTIGQQSCRVTLLAGVTVNIPIGEISETRTTPPQEKPSPTIAGSLADTINLVTTLAEDRTPSADRWVRWFENGGPETLSGLLGSTESAVLDRVFARISANTMASQKHRSGGKSTDQLDTWISKIRQKLRQGFPTEDRDDVLVELDSWQSWLDRNGRTAYGSEQSYQKISRDLRILHLDIVKSTGF